MAEQAQRSLEEFLSIPHRRGTPAEPLLEEAGEFPIEDGHVVHPAIKAGTIEARRYQLALASKACEASLLVVLPTGLGKTIIAALAAADTIARGEGKVLFLAPTKPLVQQHETTFGEMLVTRDQQALTGRISPDKRGRLFDEHTVLFSTPQGLRNDVEAGRVDLADVGLMIVDEAHRAVGEYAYVDLCEAYTEARADARILGLTASPGGDAERVREVMEGLRVRNIVARGPGDPDVKPYMQDIEMEWKRVDLPASMKRYQKVLEDIVKRRTHQLKRLRLLVPKPYVSRKDLVKAGNAIRARIGRASGSQKGMYFGLLTNQAVAMQALHCLELLETQGVEPLRDYLERSDKNPESKADRGFLKEDGVQKMLAELREWEGYSHPKIPLLIDTLEAEFARDPDSLVIVFAQYRDTIKSILRALDTQGIPAYRFVGQGSREDDPGLTQEDQKAILDQFRAKQFRVLVASSVAEEGLDIPSVDLVVFYEPVPSEVRLIQRRGRTGRRQMGRVTLLIANDTRDEAFLHAGRNREKKMRKIVQALGDEGITTLDVDFGEKGGG